MYPYIWIFSLKALGVASLVFKPHELLDLPTTTSHSDPISKVLNSRNDGVPSIVSANSLVSTNSSRSNAALGHGKYECDKVKFGQPSIDSCKDAYTWMSFGRETLSYKDRTSPGIKDVVLPLRYSSST